MSAIPPPLTPEQKKEDRRPELWAVTIVMTLLPQLAVGLRIYARKVTRQPLWWDDWIVVVAALLSWLQFACIAASIKLGMGLHQLMVPLENLEPFLKITYVSELWYPVNITLVKCSILCLYIRLFRIKKGFVLLCWGMIGFVLAWFTGIFLSTVFQCIPVQAAWVKTPEMLATAWCVDLKLWLIGNNVPNLVADIVIILMPLPLVWDLKLSLMRKLGLCFTFLLAFMTTAISIVRVVKNTNIDTMDVTYGFVDVGIYSETEGDIGIVCACLPVLAPLVRMAVGKRPNASTATPSGYVDSGKRSHFTGQSGSGSSHPSRLDNFSRLDDLSDTENLFISSGKIQGKETTLEGGSFVMSPIGKP